jgi:hypothetical protein
MRNSEKTNETRQPILAGRLARAVSTVLVVALLVAALPSPALATWQDLSGTLPGTMSKGELIGVCVGGGAVIGLAIYFLVHHKRHVHPHVDAVVTAFNDLAPGQASARTVPVINNMKEKVSVVSIDMEDSSGPFKLSAPPSLPRPLAPGETLDIPVTITPNGSGGSTKLRIVVASTANPSKDEVEIIRLSYGHRRSLLPKL